MPEDKKIHLSFAIAWIASFIVFLIVGILRVFQISNAVLDPLFYPSLIVFVLSAAISTAISQND